MRGEVSRETAVEAPASAVWAAYRGLEHGRLMSQLMEDSHGTAQVLLGDGGVGTIVTVTFPPGTPGVGYVKELFTKMDDEKRIKETETIEGGFKAIGFDACRVRREIVETGLVSSIIVTTVQYEVDDSKAHLVSYINTSADQIELMAQKIGSHVAQTYNVKSQSSV